MANQPWPPPPNKTPDFYKQGWFAGLTLFFCFPIGLVLMWLYQRNWHIATKSIISGVFALFMIGIIAGSSNNVPAPTSPTAHLSPAFAVALTPAQKKQAAKAAKKQAAQAKIAVQHQKEADAKAAAQQKRQEETDARNQAEAARQQEKADREQAEYNQTHYKSNGLTLDTNSVHWGGDDSGFGSYITGKITNDSGDDLDYAEITYKELDGEGNQVGTAQDNITHLAAGATWKFKCIVTEDSTKHVHLDELKTTPF